MTRNTLTLILAGCVVVLAAVLLFTQRDIPGQLVATDDGTRVEAPGHPS